MIHQATNRRVKINRFYNTQHEKPVTHDDPTMEGITIYGDAALADELGVSVGSIYLWKRSGTLTAYRKECSVCIYQLLPVINELLSKGVEFKNEDN